MSLEVATYIDTLNSANPPGGDPVSQADDHIRLIKAVLQSTFPNLNAAVSSTPKKLNSDLVPVGGILFWYGSTATIPAGWGYCDGSTYAKLDGSGNITTPDLRDKFVICTGTTYVQGATGGSATHSHANTAAFTGTPFSIGQANLPNVNWTVTDPGHTHGVTDPGHSHSYVAPAVTTVLQYTVATSVYASAVGAYTSAAYTGISINSNTTGITVSSGGSGTQITPAGTVAMTNASANGLPPYHSLVPIMKL